MARYLFASHDGFGLGHVRRNTLIARALLARDPDAQVVLVTGLPLRPAWLGGDRIDVVRVPALLKDADGAYRNPGMPVEDALARREEAFSTAIGTTRPDAVIVDRHPYGLAGELRDGLDRAARQGAALVLGLRDVLDSADAVAAELAGDGWAGVTDRYDEVLVYGDRLLCDHEREYGLPVTPRYVGWVTEKAPPRERERGLVVVSAGGGGDGAEVFRLGAQLSKHHEGRVVVVAGPYAGDTGQAERAPRTTVIRDAPGCAALLARAEGVVQMAGYNCTAESLAAGLRPVLVPRRSPRREQAIRASRLAALGLADVVDEGVPVEEVAWLLDRRRILDRDPGLRLDGADRAAAEIRDLTRVTVR